VQAARRLLQESGQGSALLELRVAMDLAEAYRTAGRNREANAAFAQASERLAAAGRGETETAGTLLNNWALVVRALGQPLAAEGLFRRAIMIGSASGAGDSVSPMLLNNLARTLMDLDRLSEARDYADRVDVEARRGGNEVVITLSLFLRNLIYLRLGDLPRAASILAELEPRLTRRYPAGHYFFAVLASQQGLLAQARGDAAAARAAQDRAIAIAEATPQGPIALPTALLRRSELELASNRLEEARFDAARALDLERRAAEAGALSSRIGLAHLALGRALDAQGKFAEAQAAFAAAREHLEPSLGADHPSTQEARRLALDSRGH
jgi:tetratricopeptide (TPR) repeat protein